MLSDSVARLVRTFVPIAVGWLVSVLGLSADMSAELTVTLSSLIMAGYYALARLLETKVSPEFGWLLGSPAQNTKPETFPVKATK